MWTGKHLPRHVSIGYMIIYQKMRYYLVKDYKTLAIRQHSLENCMSVAAYTRRLKDIPMMDLIFMSGVWKPSIEMDSPFNGYTGWLRKNYSQFYQELKKKIKKFSSRSSFHSLGCSANSTIYSEFGWRKTFFLCHECFRSA